MDSCLRRNDGELRMTEGWEWRKSLKWSGVRTSESMVTVPPPPAPTELILNTVALSLISPRRAGGEGIRVAWG